jgi:hypothetical protein
MKIQAYQCDECGVQKKESNHWVLAFVSTVGGLNFWPWSDISDSRAIHLCGEGCAAKVLSKQIASWKLQPREEAR